MLKLQIFSTVFLLIHRIKYLKVFVVSLATRFATLLDSFWHTKRIPAFGIL